MYPVEGDTPHVLRARPEQMHAAVPHPDVEAVRDEERSALDAHPAGLDVQSCEPHAAALAFPIARASRSASSVAVIEVFIAL